jgi:small subunit ribosomal protein S6
MQEQTHGKEVDTVLATRDYELMVILHPGLDEEGTEALLQRIRTYLNEAKATVKQFDTWGLRRLAYRIKHQKEGRYYLVRFSADPNAVKQFERNLLLAEGVLRELIVRLEEPAPAKKEPVVVETAQESAEPDLSQEAPTPSEPAA